MSSNLNVIPERTDCPRRFCFYWMPIGSRSAPGTYTSLEAGIAAALEWPATTQAGCGCSDGVCSRIEPTAAVDWYEPHEPQLDAAGLPWDYFVVRKVD